MASSAVTELSINLADKGIEVSVSQPLACVWSLGCDIIIEDMDAVVQETKVNDIVLAGNVLTESISVDIEPAINTILDLDVTASVNGVSSSITESQVVPYEMILQIEGFSPEAISEKRYASSAFAVKKIHELLSALDTKVENLELNGGGGSGNPDIDLSKYAKITYVDSADNAIRKRLMSLEDMWVFDNLGNLTTKYNLVVNGDVSSSQDEGEPSVIGISGIRLNGTTYYDTDSDGVIDLGTIISGGGGLTSVSWNDIQGKPTSLSAFVNDMGFITAASLANYQPLSTAINTGNIRSHAPSLTGEGATGNWNVRSAALYAPYRNSTTISEVAETLRYHATIPNSFASWCTDYNNAVLNISRHTDTGYSSQLGFSGGGMYYRHQNKGTWGDWKTIAFLDSNVASATKLQTARSLWGQSFNGTADIGGNLTINNGSNIMGKHTNGSGMALVGMGSNNSAYFGYGTIEKSTHTYIDGSNIYMRTGSSRANRIVIDSSGKVGINMDSPSYRFDVNGDIGVNAIIFKNNSGGFYHKDGDANSQVLGYNMTNKLLTIGIGTSARGYETRVRGNIITLYYGTSGVKGFTMDANGNAIFEKDVVVKGDIASA